MVSLLTNVWNKFKNHYCDKMKSVNFANLIDIHDDQNYNRNVEDIMRNISMYIKTNGDNVEERVENPKNGESRPWKNLVNIT